MKTYRAYRVLIFAWIICGIFYFILTLPWFILGFFNFPEVIAYVSDTYLFGFIVLSILGLVYGYRTRVTISGNGISVSYKVIRFKELKWNEIESIQYRKHLFRKPSLHLIYHQQNKPKKLQLPKIVEPYHELIQTIYLQKNLPFPKHFEKYLNRVRNLGKRWKEIVLGVIYLLSCLAAIWLYYETIPYGPGLIVQMLVDPIWLVGIILQAIHMQLSKAYSSNKQWFIVILGAGLVLSFLGILQTMFVAQDFWIILTISIMIAVFFSLFLICVFKDSPNTIKFSSFAGVLVFILFMVGNDVFIPRPATRHLGTFPGERIFSSGMVYWTPDGKEIFLNTKIAGDKPVWDVISVNSTYMVPKWMMDKNGKEISFDDPTWSPDGTTFIIYGCNNFQMDTTKYLILGNWDSQQFKIIDQLPFFSGFLYHLHAQPWSPDSKSAVIWREEYTSETTDSVNMLYYYSFDKGTSKVIYQTKNKVNAAFWAKDSTILFLTFTKIKISSVDDLRRYSLWQTKLSEPDKLSTVKPEKIYTDPEPWYSYRFSPSGKYLLITINTTTTTTRAYYILDIQKRQKYVIPSLEKVLEEQWPSFTWHPREDKLLYSIRNHNKSDIYEFDLITRQTRKIYTEPAAIGPLEYSGTGNQIAYYVSDEWHFPGAIVSIKIDGTDWKRVVPSVFSGTPEGPTFAWQPNGDKLAFLFVTWTAYEGSLKVYTASFD